MRIKLFRSLAVLGFAALLAGCVSTVDGQMRAGVPFTKDRIESRYERSIAQISQAATTVLDRNGQLASHDIVNNTFEGRVDTRRVWVSLNELEGNVTQVLVQARTKGGRADVDLASEIDKQIALELATR
jgi:hypothetical protein